MRKSLITLIVPEEILKDFEYTGHELKQRVYMLILDYEDANDVEHLKNNSRTRNNKPRERSLVSSRLIKISKKRNFEIPILIF